jgi:serine 3-dehydrogenase
MSVFISGASSGIGEACARAFAASRRDLILAARRGDRLEKLSRELQDQFGVKVTPVVMDVRDRLGIEKLAQEHRDLFETVDVLINNAGLAKGRDVIQKGRPEDWDLMIDTNLKGLLYVTRTFLPSMIQKKRGHIVNIGSVAGQWVYQNGNVYCASKFGVKALSESLRYDLHGSGIRVTEISPGMVKTEFSQVRFEGDQAKADAIYAGKTPLTAQDIAETVLWCVQRPAHVNIQELIIFPTEQPSVHPTTPQV